MHHDSNVRTDMFPQIAMPTPLHTCQPTTYCTVHTHLGQTGDAEHRRQQGRVDEQCEQHKPSRPKHHHGLDNLWGSSVDSSVCYRR